MRLAPVFEGQTRFVPPHAESAPLARPVLWIETPVLAPSGEIIAALGFGEYTDGRFAQILAAGSTGDTGEAYAFDRSGQLLSPGRFGSGATPLAALSKGAADGMVLEPYESYHGGRVIGAWRWLAQYDIGVAVEMGAAEAYAPLRYLNIAFGVVFGALVIAVFAAAASALSVVRLRRQMGAARKLGAYRWTSASVKAAWRRCTARHDLLRRPAAVKLLKPARATDEMIARFEREVQMASSLSHPEHGGDLRLRPHPRGPFYYAMEYLDGLTVGEIVARDGFSRSHDPFMSCARFARRSARRT